MENRIKVNGIWYVKEENHTPTEKFEILESKELEVSVDNYTFTLSVLKIDEEFKMPSVDFLDRDTQIKEIWDNEDWLSQVTVNDKLLKESLPDLRHRLAFIQLIDRAKELKFLG